MPRTKRTHQFFKALFNSNKELRVNKKILVKHLSSYRKFLGFQSAMLMVQLLLRTFQTLRSIE